MAEGVANCSKTKLRTRLFKIFNCIKFIFGIGIITGGFLTLNIYQDYAHFTDDTSGRAVLIVLICAGFFNLISTFLYFCPSFVHICILKRRLYFIIVILILELSAGISGYVLRDDINKQVDENMRHLQREYNSSTPTKNLFDMMQQDLKCCGVHNYTDWMGWIADQPEIIPISCCKVPDTAGCFIIGSATFDVNIDPCYSVLTHLLITNIEIIAGVAIGFAVIEMSVSIYMRCSRKKNRDNQDD